MLERSRLVCAMLLTVAGIIVATHARAEKSPNWDLLEGQRFSDLRAPRDNFSRHRIVFHGPADLTAFTSHPILAEAARYLGRGNPTGRPGPWCRWFVNKVLEDTGHRLKNRSGMAIDALSLGVRVRDPQPGDLAVLRGHVTFFVGYGPHGRIRGLGGNQHHRVQISSYAIGRVVAFVRPS